MAELDINKVLLMLNAEYRMAKVFGFQLNDIEQELLDEILQILRDGSDCDNEVATTSNGHHSAAVGNICTTNHLSKLKRQNNSTNQSRKSKKRKASIEIKTEPSESSQRSHSRVKSTNRTIEIKREIKKMIENSLDFLFICPYCKYRNCNGHIKNLKNQHMKICKPKKKNELKAPFRMATIDEFLRIPRLPIKRHGNHDTRSEEELLIDSFENSLKPFFICSYCEKRTSDNISGRKYMTREHMKFCDERDGRNLKPKIVFNLADFLNYPQV